MPGMSLTVDTDSSQYPNEHTYFGYSDDAGALESDIARIIDNLPMKAGRSLREVVEYFVEDISHGGNYECDDGNESDDDDADFMMLDEDIDFSSQVVSQPPQLSLGHLGK